MGYRSNSSTMYQIKRMVEKGVIDRPGDKHEDRNLLITSKGLKELED